MMGEFGAEVIKIEQPGSGDPLRRSARRSDHGDTFCWLSEARNKKSVTLDLRRPQGADSSAAWSPTPTWSARTSGPARWRSGGSGYEALAAINPRLVMLRISGYGQDGPYRNRPGFARIAHAFGGLAHLTGMPGGPPLTPGSTSLADYVSGLYGALGVLLALRARDATDAASRSTSRSTNRSCACSTTWRRPTPRAASCATAWGSAPVNACRTDISRPRRRLDGDRLHQRQDVRAAGAAMGRPDLRAAGDLRLAARRIADNKMIDGLVTSWVGGQPHAEVLERCVAGEVPCALVSTIADIFADPHCAARGNLQTSTTRRSARLWSPAPLPRLSRDAWTGERPGSDAGQRQ